MKMNLKELISKLVNTPMVIEQGVDASGWSYRKWSDGMLEAERFRDIGQYTIGTVEGSPIRVGNTVSSTLPSMALSGSIEVTLAGNSSNSPTWIERLTTTDWRIAKVTSSNITLQNMTVCERTVGAKWK